jgi:hypothetical protein
MRRGTDERVMSEFVGNIVRSRFGQGTKSEHEAVILQTADVEYRLRRAEGTSFCDAELESLVGRRVRCQGIVHQGVLILHSWTVLDA